MLARLIAALRRAVAWLRGRHGAPAPVYAFDAGPPEHWVEMVRRRAPGLLYPSARAHATPASVSPYETSAWLAWPAPEPSPAPPQTRSAPPPPAPVPPRWAWAVPAGWAVPGVVASVRRAAVRATAAQAQVLAPRRTAPAIAPAGARRPAAAAAATPGQARRDDAGAAPPAFSAARLRADAGAAPPAFPAARVRDDAGATTPTFPAAQLRADARDDAARAPARLVPGPPVAHGPDAAPEAPPDGNAHADRAHPWPEPPGAIVATADGDAGAGIRAWERHCRLDREQAAL